MLKAILGISTVAILLFCNTAQADATVTRNYPLVWGVGAGLLEPLAIDTVSISSAAFEQTNKLILWSDTKWVDNPVTRLINFGSQGAVGSWFFITIPHETAHYLRAREAGIEDVRIVLEPTFGGGHYVINTTIDESTPQMRAMIAAAGMENSSLTAAIHIRKMYSGQWIPPHANVFIIGAKLVDGLTYYWRTRDFLTTPNGWLRRKNREVSDDRSALKYDPIAYSVSLAEHYGYYDDWLAPNDPWLVEPDDAGVYVNEFVKDQFNRMKWAYMVSLFDPAVITSLIASVRYVVFGECFYRTPMIPMGKLAFMPSIRANLGMWGVENYFDMHFLYDNRYAFSLSYRYGGNLHERVDGVGIRIDDVSLSDQLRVSAELDIWNLSGVHFMGRADYRFYWFGLVAAMGYKTQGSLPGKPTGQGVYGFAGVAFNLDYKTGTGDRND